MFKLSFNVLTKNSGIVASEQFFGEGERETAIHFAARYEVTEGYSNVRLLAYENAKSLVPVAVALPKPGEGVAEFKRKRLDAVKFEFVKFAPKKVAAKTARKSKKVAATVSEFDLPPAPKKRISKRERAFGPEATARTVEGVEAATA